MPRTQLPIANGFYVSDSLPISAQNAVNVYPVIEGVESLSQETLRGCPGLRQRATTGGDRPCRGSHVLDGSPYFVIGDTLYSFTAGLEDGTGASLTARTGAIDGSGQVAMAENGTQLCILTSEGTGYTYTFPGTVTEIADSDFTANGTPIDVVFLDGYFVFATDAKKIIVSGLNDGTDYLATDFGAAESSPDGLVALAVFKNRLFAFGTETVETFTNVGGSGFPFQRSNLFLSQGLVGRDAVQATPDALTWIGGGRNFPPSVWVLSGNAAERISTRPIDSLLLAMTADELENITSWSYGQDGHYFVGWNLKDTTVVYDFTTGRWHERTSRFEVWPNQYEVRPHRGINHIYAFGRVFCGDIDDGRIGEVSANTYDEYGSPLVRSWTTQPFQNNLNPFSVPYLEMHMESGVGNSSAEDPFIVMERSTDGGRNFLVPRPRPLGKQGEYHRRAIWRRNGRPRMTDVYRFTVSDPVKVAGIQLVAEIAP